MMPYRRVISPVSRVYWAGWESTTIRLQQAGWQLSMEEDFASMMLRLAIKHPKYRMYGLSSQICNEVIYEIVHPDHMIFNIDSMASDFRFRHPPTLQLPEAAVDRTAIDARPVVTYSEKSIEDMFPFRRVNGEELVVEPDTVPLLLDKILKMQSPKQKEIREKLRREASRTGKDIMNPYSNTTQHAQIITLAA